MSNLTTLVLGGLAALGIVALPATLGSMWSTILSIRAEHLEQAACRRSLRSGLPIDLEPIASWGGSSKDRGLGQ